MRSCSRLCCPPCSLRRCCQRCAPPASIRWRRCETSKRPMRTRRLLVALASTCFVVPAALAQSQVPSASEALLDALTGRWVMTGTIAKKPTTHDVDVDWVLEREYIRIHEVSRDTDAGGGPGYEAWIYIVWDTKKSEYAVMWLDNTAPTNFAPEGI